MAPSQSPDIYSDFATHYDSVMGDPEPKAAFLLEIIKKYHPAAKRLLELACGTGAILQHLTSDYECEGLDISEEMLEVAKKRLPHIPLHRQDMSSFSLPAQFDVIICVFDSINHLLKYSDWESLFRSVREHLAETGVFIFDMNTQAHIDAVCESSPWIKPLKDGEEMKMDVKNLGKGISSWSISVTKGKEEMYKEEIFELVVPSERVEASLKNCFKEIHVFDREQKPITADTKKAYYVCKGVHLFR